MLKIHVRAINVMFAYGLHINMDPAIAITQATSCCCVSHSYLRLTKKQKRNQEEKNTWRQREKKIER